MTTEQIIETLQDWKRIWKPTGEVGLTLDAAIEELKFFENKLRLVVARQNEVIQQLKKERYEARKKAVEFRDHYEGDDIDAYEVLPWEKHCK